MLEVCSDTGHANFAVATVHAAIEADPRIAGRLALWGRRLVGEAMSQAQRVAAERDGLTTLLVGGVGRQGMGLAELGAMFTRLTEAHTQRMQTLGLPLRPDARRSRPRVASSPRCAPSAPPLRARVGASGRCPRGALGEPLVGARPRPPRPPLRRNVPAADYEAPKPILPRTEAPTST